MNVTVQHNSAPSVYREVIEKRGYGFHHWDIASKNFDDDVAQYRKGGAEQAFFLRVPSGGRVALGWDGKDRVRPFA